MPIIFYNDIGKAGAKNTGRKRLNHLINEEEPQLVYFQQKMWENQSNAITYKEMREYILNGELDQNVIGDWQQDYSRFVVKHMEPRYTKAIEEANRDLESRYSGTYRSYMRDKVREYTDNQSARFVTNCTAEQTQAIRQVVRRAANIQDISVDGLARAIRPMVGLNQVQANANMNYYQNLIDHGMSEKQALEKSLRYAEKQHRYRAYAIARTELAFAYNNGEFEGVKQAQQAGLMGRTVKKWCDADDARVCKVCKALSGVELELDEWFDFKTKLPQSARCTPPAHTQCRCVLLYIEKEPPSHTTPARFSDDTLDNTNDSTPDNTHIDIPSDAHDDIPADTNSSTPDDIPTNDQDDLVQNDATLPELQEMAEQTEQIVEQYIDIPSKWSGEVKWNNKTRAIAAKDWNCDILARPGATLHSFIHEHLHARSVSYFGPSAYIAYMGFEELVVEFCAREISKSEKIEITHAPAYNLVEELQYINLTLHLADTDFEFAKMLMKVPLPERKEWLKRQIIQHAENFTTYNKMIRVLEGIDKWGK